MQPCDAGARRFCAAASEGRLMLPPTHEARSAARTRLFAPRSAVNLWGMIHGPRPASRSVMPTDPHRAETEFPSLQVLADPQLTIGSKWNHLAFGPHAGLVAALPLSLGARPKRKSDRRRREARRDWSFVSRGVASRRRYPRGLLFCGGARTRPTRWLCFRVGRGQAVGGLRSGSGRVSLARRLRRAVGR